MIVSMLAIWKAGAAYLPIDPNSPVKQLQYLLEDAAVHHILTEQEHVAKLSQVATSQTIVVAAEWTTQAAGSLQAFPAVGPEDLAYVMYTSGSTGYPKGVMVEHGSLSNRLRGEAALLGLDEHVTTCLLTNYVFDVSLLEIFLALICGGTVVIPSRELAYEPPKLLEELAKRKVNLLQGTPSFLAGLVHFLEPVVASRLALQTICIGGESLTAKLVSELKERLPAVQLNNHYGPTETTIDAIVLPDVTAFNRNVIGRPMPGTVALILDEAFNIVPMGCVGELVVGGSGVARGYLNRPELTYEGFVAGFGPLEGRFYRTGDLASWLPDGSIEFKGRKDDQVKIRGHRIELDEVAYALQKVPGVQQCAVVARPDHQGELRLMAYLVPTSAYDPAAVQTYLREHLPLYMIPAAITEMVTLPLTSNGKVDKSALPTHLVSTSEAHQLPQNALESALAAVWQEFMGIDALGTNESFFALGGHSLSAVKLVARINKALKVHLNVRDLFVHPTIRELAAYLHAHQLTLDYIDLPR
jgi:amino acid adenylation domain-containing protein